MNKHFEDARYYLKRAGQTAKQGIAEELAPVERRFRELTSDAEDVEPSRFDALLADLTELQERAEGEAREAIANARERIEAYRASRRAQSAEQ